MCKMKLKSDDLERRERDCFQRAVLQDMHSQEIQSVCFATRHTLVSADAVRCVWFVCFSRCSQVFSSRVFLKQQDEVVLDVFVWFDVLSAAVVWSFIPVLSILEVRRGLVHDDLDNKVLLDLGVLQAGLVCEELAGEEPALVGRVDVLLGLQLFLEQADGVGHAGAQTHVFAGGEPYLQLELFLLSSGGLGVVRQVFFASFGDQIDRRGQAINRELVTVSEFVVTLGQRSWRDWKIKQL